MKRFVKKPYIIMLLLTSIMLTIKAHNTIVNIGTGGINDGIIIKEVHFNHKGLCKTIGDYVNLDIALSSQSERLYLNNVSINNIAADRNPACVGETPSGISWTTDADGKWYYADWDVGSDQYFCISGGSARNCSCTTTSDGTSYENCH